MVEVEVIRKAIDEAAGLTIMERCGSEQEREDTEVERLQRHAALDRLVARAVKAEAERDSWRTLAEGWKLTDDVEQHRV